MALVSIILPVYNGESFILESIRSILKQTLVDFSLTVVDDGSSDSTIEKIESIKDERINLVSNEKNMGLIHSLNRGLGNISDCKYIARMDADDLASPRRLEHQIGFLNSHLEYGVLGTSITHFGNNKKDQNKFYPEYNNLISASLICKNPMAHPTVVFRSNLIDHITYDENFPKYEDYALWIKLTELTKFYNLQIPLLRYRRHHNNITNSYGNAKGVDYQIFYKLVDRYLISRDISLSSDNIGLLATITAKSRYHANNNITYNSINRLLIELNAAKINDFSFVRNIILGKAIVYFINEKKYKDLFGLIKYQNVLANLNSIYKMHTYQKGIY